MRGISQTVTFLKLGAAAAAFIPGMAFAQSSTANEDNAYHNEIVVTGTLIRGKAPTGQQAVTISKDDITQLGATDTSQLLSSVPQDIYFNDRPQVGAFGPYQSTNTPRLRYLGNGTAASPPTLLLLDGARLPGMGILQTAPDIDAIAPGSIERLDVVTDGGSATYGSDAVGGVINMITRKRFDGVQVDGHFGGAANYKQYDLGGTIGKTWNTGSVWLAYQFSHHDAISNADRPYAHSYDYTGGKPYVGSSFDCSPGNYAATVLTSFSPITLTNFVYPVANGAPVFSANPIPNRCDLSTYKTFFPSESRHSVMAGFDVDLSDTINFNVKAFYTHRTSANDDGPTAYEVDVPGAVFPVISAKAYGNTLAAFGPHNIGHTKLETWAVVPRVTIKLGHDWQASAFLNIGQGQSEFSQRSVDSPTLATQVASGAFNPYTGIFANTTAGQAAQDYQRNYVQFSSGKDFITNARAVIDGPLFKLPAGDVRVAFGAEWFHEEFTQRNGFAESNSLNTILPHKASRTVNSVFGELLVPLASSENGFSLNLSAAGRYDHYSDFGSTFNPKFGVDLKPVSWWTVRGTWSKSYQAPSLAASSDAIPPGLVPIPAGIFGIYPGAPNVAGKTILLLYPGGGKGLKPQTAKTWELGTDIRPEFIPGLSISLTYYHIDFKNQIAFAPFFDPTFFPNYTSSYIVNTTGTSLTPNGGNLQALTTAIIQNYVGYAYNAAQASTYINDPNNVYALEDGLQANLTRTITSGLDFDVRYKHDTSFGSIFGGVSGNYLLTYDSQANPLAPPINLDGNHAIRWRTSTNLGASVGAFMGRVTWNRTGGYQSTPGPSNDFQTRVKPFNVINLAFQYAFPDKGPLKGTRVNLNIDNLFDQDPPVDNGRTGYSGFTLGRFVQIGISKKF